MGDYEVILQGGAPWGIRLQGGVDYNTPLKIAQVTAGSKSELKGVLAGSIVLEINGNKTEYLAMSQAQALVKVTGNELVLRMNHPDKAPPVFTRVIIMEGGKPWGLRLKGGRDHGMPLMIAQVTAASKAALVGLVDGEHILSINNLDSRELSMLEAQNIIKETGDKLKLIIQSTKPPVKRTSKEIDESFNEPQEEDEKKAPFMDELKESMGNRDVNWGRQHTAKGNTFISLQEHTDAGLGQQVRTVFDVPASDRNKSIPILAPRVSRGSESVDDADAGNLDESWEITMVGGKPWGIRLQGGKVAGTPLKIAQVTPDSKAALVGLVDGEHILSINDIDSKELSMLEAQNIIKETGDKLKLRIQGTKPPVKRTSKEIDESFYEDLRISMQGCTTSDRNVKSHAFKKLQNIVDTSAVK